MVQDVHIADGSRGLASSLTGTLRSRATNSQARRFVIAIYEPWSSPSLALPSFQPCSTSLSLSFTPTPTFQRVEHLMACWITDLYTGPRNTRQDAVRDTPRTCLRRRKYKLRRQERGKGESKRVGRACMQLLISQKTQRQTVRDDTNGNKRWYAWCNHGSLSGWPSRETLDSSEAR